MTMKNQAMADSKQQQLPPPSFRVENALDLCFSRVERHSWIYN